MPVLFSCILLLALPASLYADRDQYWLNNSGFVQDVQKATDLVYNQEYARADSVMSSWFSKNPDHPVAIFWAALPVWWDILQDLEDPSHDDAFIQLMEQAERASDRVLRRDRRNLDALVVKSMVNGFLARLHANRGAWFKSISNGRVAINVLMNLEQVYPDVSDIQFGLGLYHYFTAHLNEEYRLVRAFSWVVPSGDKEDGIRRLKIAASESAFMIPEATYFLGHIMLSYEGESEKAFGYLNSLFEKYPDNSYFGRLLLRSLYSKRSFDEARALNEELLIRFGDTNHTATLEELYATRGELYLRAMEYEQAELYFEKARSLKSQLYGGANRMQQMRATFHLGRLYLRTDRRQQAHELFTELSRSPTENIYRSRARQMLER